MAVVPKSQAVHNKGVVQALVSLIRHHGLSYGAFNEHCKQARRVVGLKPSKAGRVLPKLLTKEQLADVMDRIERDGEGKPHGLRNTVLIRLMYYSAGRVAEVVGIRVSDIDLDRCEIFIDQGKGSKDRVVLFPDSFRLPLRMYLNTLRAGEEFLFPTAYQRPMSKRMAQYICTALGKSVGVYLHCHLFRHQMLTELTRAGLPTEQIQKLSGHSDPKTLAIYQHLATDDVRPGYNKAIKD